VEEVAEFAKTLPNVVYTRTNVFSCSDAGQLEIKDAIKEHNLNRVVVAACTPMIHEGTYRALLKEAGLSPYYFQMVNLREHDSFVHTDKEAATEKAKRLVAAGVARAELLEDIPVLE
jgi:heterodisulfide reductase subunit A